jgi:hypothetical protein
VEKEANVEVFVLWEIRYMNTAVGRGLKTQSWKDLYQAALAESDSSRLPGRIDDAEAAIVMRARELFYAVGDDAEEGESLDDAMCILHALRRSLKHRPSAIQSTSNLKEDAA